MAIFKTKNSGSGDKENSSEFPINEKLKVIFNSKGLVPVIIQDEKSGEVLRHAYLDTWALQMSLDEKVVYLFRRSLQRVEKLGEDNDIEYQITSIRLGKYYRSLLFKVRVPGREQAPTNFTHTIY